MSGSPWDDDSYDRKPDPNKSGGDGGEIGTRKPAWPVLLACTGLLIIAGLIMWLFPR